MSLNSQYVLVTLDQLNFSSTLSNNDLLYTLQYDQLNSKYKSEANKITGTTLNDFIKSSNGTSMTYNAGLDAGEVLLLPSDGKVPISNLPLANNTTKGIVGQQSASSNIVCTNGNINLNTNITGISKIETNGPLAINASPLLVNGELTTAFSNKIFDITTSDVVVLDRSLYGENPCYFMTISDEGVVTFNISQEIENSKKVYSFNIFYFSASGARDITLKTDPDNPLIFSCLDDTKYLLSFKLIPKSLIGKNFIFLTNITSL